MLERSFFNIANYKVDITGINTNNLTVLSHEENMALFKLLKEENNLEAKEKLINGNLKLVLSILKGYSNRGVNMDDLFQVGVIGLIKAIDNFDLTYNLKLSTYGVPLIIGEIKKFLRDNTTLRISRSIKDNAYNILRYKESYINMHGKEPSNKEIAEALNINEYEINYALESLREPMSIFEPIYNDGSDTIYLEDQIADNKNKVDNDLLISMYKALKTIDKREKDILLQRYVVGKTQAEIADKLKISQAQVSRIEKFALEKVRKLVK